MNCFRSNGCQTEALATTVDLNHIFGSHSGYIRTDLRSCANFSQIHSTVSEEMRHEQTDTQTDRQKDRQTNRQTDRQITRGGGNYRRHVIVFNGHCEDVDTNDCGNGEIKIFA